MLISLHGSETTDSDPTITADFATRTILYFI